jgi:SAM-dependent methyltransferase
MSEKRELLLGCGSNLAKMCSPDNEPMEWSNLTTLDINPDCKPDIIHDLNSHPLPFKNDTFDEIHAYQILEHLGRQGDYRFFFREFTEYWRILKPNGYLCANVPTYTGSWAWGDPSHTRIINEGTLVFLSQAEYAKQIGKTTMSDFRYIYKADFELVTSRNHEAAFYFILRAIK